MSQDLYILFFFFTCKSLVKVCILLKLFLWFLRLNSEFKCLLINAFKLIYFHKGQLISKCLFWRHRFDQNSNKKGSSKSFLDARWVSVVEFHDPTLIIGKIFVQESTVVKWNYQILGLHPVAVRQKLGVILVIKWFKNWSQQKMLFTKKVRLNWYSSMNFFLERFGWFLT